MSVTIREDLGDGAEDSFWEVTQNLYDRVSFNNGQLCSGLVYGSVQSGKTFSMLGVSALALDDSADIVIILGGSKSALRQQTHSRVITQLSRTYSRADERGANRKRYLTPSWDSNRLTIEPTIYINPNTWKKMYSKSKKIICTILKHHDHLKQVRRAIERIIENISADEPLKLLVLELFMRLR